MKDVIIVGTGKAGFLHYFSYKKFKNIGNLFFVDISEKIKNENIDVQKIYPTINDAIADNKLDISNIIVDICTPKSVFLDIINQCKDLGIKDIIVEKPFIVKKEFFKENEELNIVMVHNYVYSKITTGIKEIIEKENLTPKMVYTNFSKNRLSESFKGRGMYKSVTRNIELDIPHQVYITQYILGNKSTKLLALDEKSIKQGDVVLEKHGYGKIITKKDDILVIHESDLTTNTTVREVTVVCDNDTIVQGEYFIYDKDLNKLKSGTIKIYINSEVIKEINIDVDDNMYECLLEFYNYFNGISVGIDYKEQIKEFSKEMSIYMNKR